MWYLRMNVACASTIIENNAERRCQFLSASARTVAIRNAIAIGVGVGDVAAALPGLRLVRVEIAVVCGKTRKTAMVRIEGNCMRRIDGTSRTLVRGGVEL